MSYITLNKQNFFHNLRLINEHIGDKNKIAIVLKDNAYGHGLLEMAQLSHEFGLKYAIVRTIKEAQVISSFFHSVLVLADRTNTTSASNIHLTVNDISHLKSLPKHSKIELKFDTGMHRNGLHPEQLEEAFELIKQYQLELKGIFTHHRSADVLSSEFFWQNKLFSLLKKRALELIHTYDFPKVRFHTQNSAATMRTHTHDDIVRIGIAAYGLLEMPLAFKTFDFKPVLSLWAQKIHSFHSKKHFKHGYEAKGRLDHAQELSTYDIGYADGLIRLHDGQSYTLENQTRIIGRISMDNIIINSSLNDICIYNDARLYAQSAQTISYEVTTRLQEAIPRRLI